jgi:hypothetical protein
MQMPSAERATLVIEAQRKGFGVVAAEGNEGWWQVTVPARPRLPAHVQGDFKSSERAWSVAALLAVEYPER